MRSCNSAIRDGSRCIGLQWYDSLIYVWNSVGLYLQGFVTNLALLSKLLVDIPRHLHPLLQSQSVYRSSTAFLAATGMMLRRAAE